MRRHALAACATQVRRRGELWPAARGDDAGADATSAIQRTGCPLRTTLRLPFDRCAVVLTGAAAAVVGAGLVVHVGAAHYDIV